MSMIGQALETLRAVLLLQDEVKRLGTNVSKIADKIETITVDIATLKAHQSSAITIAQQSAQLAVAGQLGPINERLSKIEMFLAATEAKPTHAPPILLDDGSRPLDP